MPCAPFLKEITLLHPIKKIVFTFTLFWLTFVKRTTGAKENLISETRIILPIY